MLDAGTVVERGTHDELVQLGGRYSNMLREQSAVVATASTELDLLEAASDSADAAEEMGSKDIVRPTKDTSAAAQVSQDFSSLETKAVVDDLKKRLCLLLTQNCL